MEIFEQEPGDRPATPYFLVYVMDKSKQDLVDSVCRNVVEPPPEEQQDTVMEDYNQAQEIPTTGDTYIPVNSSMEYDTADSYNSQGWTHGGAMLDNSKWDRNEAHVYSNW